VADKHRVAGDARPVPGVASLRGKLRCVHRAAKGRCKIQSEALTDKEEAYEYGEAAGRRRPPIERSKVLERPSSTLTRRALPVSALFWCQRFSGVSTFLVPAPFWCQPFSGASAFLVPALFWCQHFSGAGAFLVPALFLVLASLGPIFGFRAL
jgi:hypothetical protein